MRFFLSALLYLIVLPPVCGQSSDSEAPKELTERQKKYKYKSVEKFYDQYIAKLHKYSKKKDEESAEELLFDEIWGELNDEGKSEFVRFANELQLVKIAKKRNISRLFQLSKVFIDEYPDKLQLWFTVLANTLERYQSRQNKMMKIIAVLYRGVVENNMTTRGVKQWSLTNEKQVEPRIENDSIFLYFENAGLECRVKKNAFEIENTTGRLNPYTFKFEIDKATLFWHQEQFDRGKVKAELANFTINTSAKGFEVKEAHLVNNAIFKGQYEGKVEMQLESIKKKREAKYPIFTAYGKSKVFKGIFDGFDIEGNLKIRGRKFFLFGTDAKNAQVDITIKGKKAAKLQSTLFAVTENVLSSAQVAIEIYIDDKSISHRAIQFSYTNDTKALNVTKTNAALSKAPFINTYHNVDLHIDQLIWYLEKDQIYFQMDPTNGISYVSNNFFDQDLYNKFKGLSKRSTLDLLRDYYLATEQEDFTVQEFADYIKVDKEEMAQILIDINQNGFISLNLNTMIAQFTPRIKNYWAAKYEDKDYDRVFFYAKDSAMVVSYLNLESKELKVKNIQRVNLSDKNSVYLLPSDDGLTIKKGLNFTYSGTTYAGALELVSTNTTFDYNKFELYVDSIYKLGLTVQLENKKTKEITLSALKNYIVGGKGYLVIDSAHNKSGKESMLQFPLFRTITNSNLPLNLQKNPRYIHTPDISESVTLGQFVFDSLAHIASQNFDLPGVITSERNILPAIDVDVELMDDLTFGFKTKVTNAPVYNAIGDYTNELTYNTQGLWGKGDLNFVSSLSKSKKFNFYYETMEGEATSFDVRQSDAWPKVKGKEVHIELLADTVELIATPKKEEPLNMYSGKVSNANPIILRRDGMSGHGFIKYMNAVLNSEQYAFKPTEITSERLDAEMLDKALETVVEIHQSVGKLSVVSNKGQFSMIKDTSTIDFLPNLYRGYMQTINWDLNSNNLTLINPIEDSINTPELISYHRAKDSLTVVPYAVGYNLEQKEIKASKVKPIQFAHNAFVILPDEKIEINTKGDIKPIKGAKIEVKAGDTISQFIKQVDIDIKGRYNVAGTGKYSYINAVGKEDLLNLDRIKVDSTNNYIYAHGEVKKEDKFNLNEQFKYYGQLIVNGAQPYPKFEGNTTIARLDCPGIKVPGLPINSYINPKDVRIEPSSDYIFNGFYNNQAKYEPTFLANDSALFQKPIANILGPVGFLPAKSAFEVAKKDPFALVPEYVRLYNRACKFETKTKINVGNYNHELMYSAAYGKIESALRTKKQTMKASFVIDFPFDPVVTGLITDRLDLGLSVEIEEEDTDEMNMLLQNELDSTEAFNYNEAMVNLEIGRQIPKSFNKMMIFNGIEMTYDKKRQQFTNDKQTLPLHIFNGKYLAKVFKGYFRMKPGRTRDEFTIYLQVEDGNWFYFGITEGFLTFATDDLEIMDMIVSQTPEQREIKVEKVKDTFKYRPASKSEVDQFVKLFERKKNSRRRR